MVLNYEYQLESKFSNIWVYTHHWQLSKGREGQAEDRELHNCEYQKWPKDVLKTEMNLLDGEENEPLLGDIAFFI